MSQHNSAAISAFLRFTPGRALPRWYRFIAAALSRFYYSSIALVNPQGQPLAPFNDATPTLFVASHRNGATDGWVFSQLAPHAQFMASAQLLRSRLLRLLFTGIPVVREKDRLRYGLSRAQAGNPLRQAIAHLSQGGSLMVFPEGTSEWGIAPQEYQPGAVSIIRHMQRQGLPLRVVAVGSFYTAPQRFGSAVELMVSAPLTFADDGEAQIARRLFGALDQVSVNCPDEPTFRRALCAARAARRRGESVALAFKGAQAGDDAPPPMLAATRRPLAWLLQLPWLAALFPVLLCGWLVGRQADGVNTVTFFRLLGGAGAALLWLPCLAVGALMEPGLWLLYLLAFIGWRQRAAWDEREISHDR
ncbi:1-acyl-sn-glycerol-3-phosphate acyltransferase [Entomohabitans teleogrylli]|uniref:1-acyl-sn-glycerol-3-phosphate acyltransferase n=1 Tax=Entomohabitans teleogrylli TaxID=1384589 RepID=UPI00073D73E4|nr:1-acyl-sn-glycerol-3-phosphate acyltransferase [Entomohabitans teleogrylli]